MHLFIDESGDCGMKTTSAPLFALTAVILEDQTAIQEAEAAIARVRSGLGKKNEYEFHFTRIGHEARLAFLEELASSPFQFTSVILEKSKIEVPRPWREKKFFYEQVIGMLTEQLKPSLLAVRERVTKPVKARVIADDNQDPVYFTALRDRFVALKDSVGRSLISKVKPGRSNSSDLLQLADMVCGSVVSALDGQVDYLWLIRHKQIDLLGDSETEKDDPGGSSSNQLNEENLEKLGGSEPCRDTGQ